MVQDKIDDGWTRWEPAIAKSANWTLAEAIRAFEPPDYVAGRECARWLKEESLVDYPHTITWVLCNAGVIEGFFAICSGVFELELPHSRPEDDVQSVKWPCSVIKWMCRRGGHRPGGGEYDGRPIINQAIARAKAVGKTQGNVALVIEPFDEVIAGKLLKRHEFLRMARQGQLWMPLYEGNDLLVP